MQDLFEKAKKFDAVIIFGVAAMGKILFTKLEPFCKANGMFLCFADNSYKKWSENTFPTAEAAQKYPDALWIIATDMRMRDMFENLIEIGIQEKNIVKELPQEIISEKQNEDRMRRLTPQTVLNRFEIHLAEHCNFSCAGCSTCSPLVSEPVFPDFKQVDHDLKRMSYLLEGKLNLLQLCGGEPLLNNGIEDYLKSARVHFPDTKISIVSNGMLLPKMNKSFWDSCRENNIVIAVTKYPVKFDYDKMITLVTDSNVTFEFYGHAVEKTSFHYAFDPSGKHDPYEMFAKCFLANYCPTLKQGKLTTCCRIQTVEHINTAFGLNMKPCPEDFIDIYEAKSGREILEFLAKPVPFCRFCDVENRTMDNPWRPSKNDIREWIL